MTQVLVSFSLSLDGFGAGPDQDIDNPLGRRGMELHEWAFATKRFHDMIGEPGGAEGVDNDHFARGLDGFGAFILGRNMFGPARGDWSEPLWQGWWGDNPPFHAPTYILTHYPRPPLEMKGGTTFYFVTEGIEAALAQAKAAARGKDVKIGGGVSTIRQYLKAGLIDELQFTLSPVVLGQGEAMFDGLDLPALGFRVSGHVTGEKADHYTLRKEEKSS